MFDEYLKLNIIQNGNKLCGYTFDFVLKDKKSYCKTYFTGNYNPVEKIWILKGNSFIVNSGDHELMTLKFWRSPQENSNLLRGVVSNETSFFNFLDAETGNTFWIKKISSNPQSVPGHELDCFVSKPKVKDKQKNKCSEINRKIYAVSGKTDSLKYAIKNETSHENTPKSKSGEHNEAMNKASLNGNPMDTSEYWLVTKALSRKNVLFQTIKTSTPEIEIKVYDNGIIDNDTVSIVFNGTPIKTKSRLTEEPLVIKLSLNPAIRRNELILFAENLGGIPPNSAFLIVKAGTKRYEIHAKANMNQNALLIFDYQPEAKD